MPIHTAQFHSNWELSTARATELIEMFITRYHFAPARLAAAGYAEYHPVDSNGTAEGKAHNRRVDIVVLKPSTVPVAVIGGPKTPGTPDAAAPAKAELAATASAVPSAAGKSDAAAAHRTKPMAPLKENPAAAAPEKKAAPLP